MSSISTFLLTRTQKEPFMSCLQMPILPLRIMLHVKSTANMQLVQMKKKKLGRVSNTSWSVNDISPLMRESLVPLTLDGVLVAPLKKTNSLERKNHIPVGSCTIYSEGQMLTELALQHSSVSYALPMLQWELKHFDETLRRLYLENVIWIKKG